MYNLNFESQLSTFRLIYGGGGGLRKLGHACFLHDK